MPERGALARRGAQARIAIALLTRIPVGRIADPVPPLSAAAWAFPLAGALAALAPAAVFWAAAGVLPPGMAAVLALALGLVITGALHEDGLADMADGFGGGRSRETKLEIMRDSRIGSYGALALVVAMALRIQGLATAPDGAAGAGALIAIGAASRAWLAMLLSTMPAARPDGLAATAAGTGGGQAGMAILLGGLALLLLPQSLPLLSICFLVTAMMGWLALRQIGGQTGDVLGATQQVTEVALWVALAGVWRWS